MSSEISGDLLSPHGDVDFARLLLADLHDDFAGKVARFRQLADLSGSLGFLGTMLFGGEVTYAAWTEARSSFVHGNFIATVLVCQGLAEHLLAAFLHAGFPADELPPRIPFAETLRRCEERRVISPQHAEDLRRLMALRNPYSHFRSLDDPSSLSRRVLDTMVGADHHLFQDASFAIGITIRVLSLPAFRLGDQLS